MGTVWLGPFSVEKIAPEPNRSMLSDLGVSMKKIDLDRVYTVTRGVMVLCTGIVGGVIVVNLSHGLWNWAAMNAVELVAMLALGYYVAERFDRHRLREERASRELAMHLKNMEAAEQNIKTGKVMLEQMQQGPMRPVLVPRGSNEPKH